jgi:hypothetical protein
MKLTSKQKIRNQRIVNDLFKFIQDKGFWGDLCIFFNGKALSSESTWNVWKGVLVSVKKNKITEEVNKVYEYTDIDSPKNWTEYANEESITIVFDGLFYDYIHLIPTSWGSLQEVLDKYDAYFEVGHSTDLSIYFN